MNRPCLWLGAAMAASAAAVGYASLSGSFLFCAAGGLALLVLASALLFRKRARLRPILYLLAGAALAAFAAGVVTVRCLEPAAALSGRTGECLLQVRAAPQTTTYGRSCAVRILSVDGEPCRIGAILYTAEAEWEIGELLAAECEIALPDAGRRIDLARLYASRGQYLTLRCGETPVRCGMRQDLLLWPLRLAARGRSQITDLFSGDAGGILAGVMFGGGDSLSDRFSDAASRSGVSHMFAVSGMHLAVLAGCVLFFIRRRGAVFVLLAVCAFFSVMTGMTPSVLRASFILLLPLIGPYLGRDSDPLNALGFALACLLAFNPWQIFSLSLQYSFAAVLGLILFGGRLYAFFTAPVRRQGRRRFALWRAVAAGVSAYLAANLFTLPITALNFGRLSVLGLAANLAVVWTLPLLFSGGFLLWALSAASPAAAAFLAKPMQILLSFVQSVVLGVGELPEATLGLRDLPLAIWFWAAYAALLAILFLRKKRRRNLLLWAIGASAALAAVLVGLHAFRAKNAVVDWLNVGSGQCAVVVSGGRTVMLDCGGRDAAGAALDYLDGANIRRVDLLAVSHADSDHVNGAETLLARGRVRELLIGASAAGEEAGQALIAAAEANGCAVTRLSETLQYDLPGGRLSFYPPAAGSAQACVTTLCRLYETDVFFAADMDFDDEAKLLYRHPLPDLEALCVAHHGAKSGTGATFLSQTRPEIAVVSVGKNAYGHPAPETLKKLKSAGAEVHTTLEEGDIRLRISEAGYTIS